MTSRGCAGTNNPGIGRGDEQFGNVGGSGSHVDEEGKEGRVTMLWVGRSGAATRIVQEERQAGRATGSERGARSISGHDVFVSENPVNRYVSILILSISISVNSLQKHTS